ncbi:unnamed protein product [Closterium sp. NIES-54]
MNNLAAERDLTSGFRGNRAFASPADEADWDEKNVDGASEEAGPLPYCSIPVPMDDENLHESINAEVYYDFAAPGPSAPATATTATATAATATAATATAAPAAAPAATAAHAYCAMTASP